MVLEIASGSSQHITTFSRAYRKAIFQSTKYDVSLFKSIETYTKPNYKVRKPIEPDTTTFRETAIRIVTMEGIHVVLVTWPLLPNHFLGDLFQCCPDGHFVAYSTFRKDEKFNDESEEEMCIAPIHYCCMLSRAFEISS
ncbi:hypothetical protein BGX21_010608 [Mortierella sp. AD011]|nr:hypothetical protein BGX20_011727 [Mortierella sp. AD010]KAF9393838.1 hypothetical protein BGX21_010608 [Mortierella sp. AD011]